MEAGKGVQYPIANKEYPISKEKRATGYLYLEIGLGSWILDIEKVNMLKG